MRRSGTPKRKTPLRPISARYRLSGVRRQAWADAVKKRDRCCQLPGCRLPHRELEAHHVYPKGTYPSLRFVMDNGLALGTECHRAWHERSRVWRTWWKERWPERAATVRLLMKR